MGWSNGLLQSVVSPRRKELVMTEEYGQNYEQTQGSKGEGYPLPLR